MAAREVSPDARGGDEPVGKYTLSPGDETPSTQVPEWTEEEERRLVARGNALTDFFLGDVGITQNQFNVGQQLLSAGIVVLEVSACTDTDEAANMYADQLGEKIPSNYVLYRIGPSVWISGQIIAWGLVAIFQAWQKGLGAFLSTRLLLGLCESGFIPAGLFTITRYYKRSETSKRFSIFFLGNMLAQATSGLIAYGVLHMRGVGGLAGWQWLFVRASRCCFAADGPFRHVKIEGLFTILVGIVFTLFFPKSTADPRCLVGISYFDERESRILTQRITLDDASKAESRRSISWAEMRGARTRPVIYNGVVRAVTCQLVWIRETPVERVGLDWTVDTTRPEHRLGSRRVSGSAHGATLVISRDAADYAVSDKLGRRGPLVSFAMLLWWIFALVNRLLIYSDDDGKRFAVLVLAISFSSIWHPVNGSWMALNARSSGERSITLAMFIMSANCSGIIGSQLFQEADGPLYRIGWSAIVGLVSLSLFLSLWANLQYWVLNWRLARNGKLTEVTRYRY
ncbi:Major Facilitator Superfamily [Geosmithia morbida]|uniref:Major Facilitator Superfamily n=1 Tax=Geosmithia morbida TaxID=1094350 RepID=A0A9P4YVN9_9HYPO|nr:Major Facilitator Superfamily [Geosmithia morbida]KAF4121859.1 Major Facilitator Superfamily [Geosmithia morbida]